MKCLTEVGRTCKVHCGGRVAALLRPRCGTESGRNRRSPLTAGTGHLGIRRPRRPGSPGRFGRTIPGNAAARGVRDRRMTGTWSIGRRMIGRRMTDRRTGDRRMGDRRGAVGSAMFRAPDEASPAGRFPGCRHRGPICLPTPQVSDHRRQIESGEVGRTEPAPGLDRSSGAAVRVHQVVRHGVSLRVRKP